MNPGFSLFFLWCVNFPKEEPSWSPSGIWVSQLFFLEINNTPHFPWKDSFKFLFDSSLPFFDQTSAKTSKIGNGWAWHWVEPAEATSKRRRKLQWSKKTHFSEKNSQLIEIQHVQIRQSSHGWKSKLLSSHSPKNSWTEFQSLWKGKRTFTELDHWIPEAHEAQEWWGPALHLERGLHLFFGLASHQEVHFFRTRQIRPWNQPLFQDPQIPDLHFLFAFPRFSSLSPFYSQVASKYIIKDQKISIFDRI